MAAQHHTPPFVLGDAEETLAAVMRITADPMAVMDLDGRVLRWNSAAEELLGWGRSDVIGRIAVFIPEEQRLRCLSSLREVALSSCVSDLDWTCVRPDGTRLSVRVAAIPVTDSDGDAAGAVIIVRDAPWDERFERHRRDFALLVSRYFAAPLRALGNQIQLLRRYEVFSDEGRRSEVVDALGESAARAAQLAERLTLLTEFERPKAILRLDEVDLDDVIADIVADLPAGRVLAELELSTEVVRADRRAISAALRALLDRASGAATSWPPMTVATRYDAAGCSVEIVDPGWPGETDDDIRLDAPTLHSPEAAEADIAIAIADGVVRAHAGTVKVERERGGARIVIRLPYEGSTTEEGTH